MKQFREVFPEEYRSPSYPTQRISQLEELFSTLSKDPDEQFFHLVLIVDGLRLRFLEAENFFKGEVYKEYVKLLEEQSDLKKRRPSMGMANIREWEIEIKKIEVGIDGIQQEKERILSQIKAELDDNESDANPQSFTEYLNLKRLKFSDGKPVSKKRALEFPKIATGMKTWPFLYQSLSRYLPMLDQTDKLLMIPKLVEADAIDRGSDIDGLVEDEAYIQELAQLMMGSDCDGLKEYLLAYRTERIKKREAANQKAKSLQARRVMAHENVISTVAGVRAGNVILVSHEDMNRIGDHRDTIEALKASFKKYAKAKKAGQVNQIIVSDENLPMLQQDVAAIILKGITDLESAKTIGKDAEAQAPGAPRKDEHKRQLFEFEYQQGTLVVDPESGDTPNTQDNR